MNSNPDSFIRLLSSSWLRVEIWRNANCKMAWLYNTDYTGSLQFIWLLEYENKPNKSNLKPNQIT